MSFRWLREIHRRLGLKYRFDRWRGFVRRFGLVGAIQTHRRLREPGAAIAEIRVPGLPHPVALRPGTADASTFEKVFVWRDYDLEYPSAVRTVVDAGANVGFSAVFFACRFPQARIIAVEPQRENFRLLRRNVSYYPNVTPVEAAIWSRDTEVGLANPADRVDSYRYDPAAVGEPIQALSVPSLLNRFAVDIVDVLKVDIEGAEKELFAARPSWVNRVRMFIVELHGSEAAESFTASVAPLGGRRYQRGENEVVVAAGAS
jgi:FkbM family methyltransferase